FSCSRRIPTKTNGVPAQEGRTPPRGKQQTKPLAFFSWSKASVLRVRIWSDLYLTRIKTMCQELLTSSQLEGKGVLTDTVYASADTLAGRRSARHCLRVCEEFWLRDLTLQSHSCGRNIAQIVVCPAQK